MLFDGFCFPLHEASGDRLRIVCAGPHPVCLCQVPGWQAAVPGSAVGAVWSRLPGSLKWVLFPAGVRFPDVVAVVSFTVYAGHPGNPCLLAVFTRSRSVRPPAMQKAAEILLG